MWYCVAVFINPEFKYIDRSNNRIVTPLMQSWSSNLVPSLFFIER